MEPCMLSVSSSAERVTTHEYEHSCTCTTSSGSSFTLALLSCLNLYEQPSKGLYLCEKNSNCVLEWIMEF